MGSDRAHHAMQSHNQNKERSPFSWMDGLWHMPATCTRDRTLTSAICLRHAARSQILFSDERMPVARYAIA